MAVPTLKSKRKGGSAIEFALLTVVWVPLLIGTLGVGTAMIRALEAVQVARDAGHLYARYVDFTLFSNQQLLSKVGTNLGLQPSGGEGVVIFSTLMYIGRQQCKAEGLADNSTPPNPYSTCTNYGHFVFTHRLKMGDPTVQQSSFGDPDGALVDSTTGAIKAVDYIRKSGARADRFTLLPAPQEDGNDGYQAGHSVYLVEAIFRTPNFGGVTSGRTYAYSIF